MLNIRRTAGIRLDLSRHDIAEGNHNWSDHVLQRCVDSFRKRAKQIITEKTPEEALYHLARLVTYGSGFRKNLGEVIGDSTLPLLVLGKSGDIVVTNADTLDEAIIGVVPENLAEGLAKTLFADWASKKWLQGAAPKIPWFGERCVFADGMIYLLRSFEPTSLSAVEQLHKAWLDVSHVLTGVRFLSPSERNEPPLMQELWLKKKPGTRKAKGRGEAIETAMQSRVRLARLRHDYGYHAPKFVSFSAPFEGFLTAGWKYLNVLHPVVEALAECIKAVADKQSVGAITEHDLGTIRDALEPLFGERRYRLSEYLSGSAIDEKCEAITQLFEITSKLEIFELSADLPWKRETLNVPPVIKLGKFGAPIQSL